MFFDRFRIALVAIVVCGVGAIGGALDGAENDEVATRDLPALFQKDNLVAWCIVPFDASRRSPAERAAMLKRLGLHKVAYDWRAEHVPSFEEEILQYQKHGLEFFAFWSWHPSLEPLITKHAIKPQIWMTLRSPDAETQQQRVETAAQSLLPDVRRCQRLGLQLGIYNHGGWGGEPENMVAVCRYLREHHDADHVGIVYNFHHGHDHIERFPEALNQMKPYLLCLNLNGMLDASQVDGHKNKIVPIGSGDHEGRMIQTVLDSGYQGPIGILDHRPEIDAEESLQQNLDGLRSLLQER